MITKAKSIPAQQFRVQNKGQVRNADGKEYEEPRPPKLVHVHSEEVIDQKHLDLSDTKPV